MSEDRKIYNLKTKEGKTRSIDILMKYVVAHGYEFSVIAQEWKGAQDAAEIAVGCLGAWLERLTAEQTKELHAHLQLAGEVEYYQTKPMVMAAEEAGAEARATAMKDWGEKPETGYDCYIDWA